MKKLLIIIFAISSINFAQFSGWEYFGNMKMPVAGGDIWQENDNFYVFGGYSDSLQINVDWVQKFGVYSGIWELDSMNFPRFGLVTESYNNLAHFFGGIDNDSNSITGIEKWGIDFTDEGIFSFNENFNRIFSTGHIIGDNFYIIGGNPLPGTSSDTLPYIIGYNLPGSEVTYQSDTLFTSGDLPEQQMSEIIGDNIFIFGGVTNGITQDIYKFNTANKTYEKLDIKLLEPRAGGRAILASEPNRIYIIGGYNESSQALNTVEIFTSFGDQYFIEEGPPLQDARYYFMSGYFDNSIYVLGGFNNEGLVVNSIEKLNEYAATEVEEKKSEKVLNDFELFQNYPNPFNPATIIQYSIPVAALSSVEVQHVSLKIFDVLGNEITTLTNKQQEPGIYKVKFDAAEYPSGIYYYQLRSGSFVQTKKMILLR